MEMGTSTPKVTQSDTDLILPAVHMYRPRLDGDVSSVRETNADYRRSSVRLRYDPH